MKTRIALLASALFFAACEGYVFVQGTVIDAETKLVVANAVVVLSMGSRVYTPDTTGTDGQFGVGTSLVGMVCGPPKVTVTITRDGYQTLTREFTQGNEQGVVMELERR